MDADKKLNFAINNSRLEGMHHSPEEISCSKEVLAELDKIYEK